MNTSGKAAFLCVGISGAIDVTVLDCECATIDMDTLAVDIADIDVINHNIIVADTHKNWRIAVGRCYCVFKVCKLHIRDGYRSRGGIHENVMIVACCITLAVDSIQWLAICINSTRNGNRFVDFNLRTIRQ